METHSFFSINPFLYWFNLALWIKNTFEDSCFTFGYLSAVEKLPVERHSSSELCSEYLYQISAFEFSLKSGFTTFLFFYFSDKHFLIHAITYIIILAPQSIILNILNFISTDHQSSYGVCFRSVQILVFGYSIIV